MHGLGSSLSCMQDMPSFVLIVAFVDGHACSCLASDKAANTLPACHYEVNHCKRHLAAIFILFYLVLLININIHVHTPQKRNRFLSIMLHQRYQRFSDCQFNRGWEVCSMSLI